MNDLKGRKAIVTGGNRGIGYAIAEELFHQGAKVMITGKNEDQLAEAAKKLSASYRVLEMRDVSHFESFVALAAEQLGGLDLLVNNAGVVTSSDRNGIEALTEEDWDVTLDINLKGVFFLTRAVASYMKAHNVKGRIVNLCSNTGFRPATMAYATSKWALRGLTMGMGRAYARDGIILNGIAPGPTSTRLMFAEDGETFNRSDIPIGRYSYPQEIAKLAAFLLSDTVGNIVGEVLVADGGEP